MKRVSQKHVKSILISGMLGAMAFASSFADVIDQTSRPSGTVDVDGWAGTSHGLWDGQQFSPDLPFLTAVEFGGLGSGHAWTSIPDGETFRARIWSTSSGLPDTLLATVERTTPLSVGGGGEWSGRFDLAAPLDVSALVANAASMFVSFEVPNASTSGEWTTGWVNGTTGDYADGTAFSSANQGGSWNIIGARDMVFRTYGDAVPEPGVFALLVCGALLLIGRKHRAA